MDIITVVTADVIGSRHFPEELKVFSKRLSELDHAQLALGFSFSRGDEVQGIMRGALAAPELIRHLRYGGRPLHLRVGIGIGPPPETWADSPWDLNGEAFYRAREALERMKASRHVRTIVNSGDATFDATANALFDLMDAISSHWTADQWEAVMAYEKAGTYEAAATELGVAFQNVEKRCRAARWPAIRSGEMGLRKLADRYNQSSPIKG